MGKLIKVVALRDGHDGRLFRSANEVFSVDSEDPRYKGADWFAPIERAPKVVVKTADPKARPPGAGPLPGSAIKDESEGKPDGDLV